MDTVFDAIVVGSGISGGWSAKELCEQGLKVLLLDRGRMIEHVKDYHTALKNPWDFDHHNLKVSEADLARQPVQNRTGFTVTEATKHHFVDDLDHPYVEKQAFDWFRGYHVGGKSLMWGRYSFRFSDLDFEANKKDKIGVDWPIRYQDLAKWYDKVERFAGIAGTKEGIEHLPDGIFQPALPTNCVENHFTDSILQNYTDRKAIPARAAHITEPTEEQTALGRAKCQYRNMCMRGCPFGAYFSTQSATLPAAQKTGNLTLIPHVIVHSIDYDPVTQKAAGVLAIDEVTKKPLKFKGKMVFLNAGAINSTFILLHSKSDRFQHGLDDSGQLGHNLMDHVFQAGASGTYKGDLDKTYFGRHPAGLYIPRFRNVGQDQQAFKRGYGYEIYTWRDGWGNHLNDDGFGAAWKEKNTQFGDWKIVMQMFGECLPNYKNELRLSKTQKDQWGLPIVEFDAAHGPNEKLMSQDGAQQAFEMLTKAGYEDVQKNETLSTIGGSIHEVGTARMGTSASDSVFNGFNQHHAVANVFCTDGAVFASSPCQNPSLTYMAMSARAADFAANALKEGKI